MAHCVKAAYVTAIVSTPTQSTDSERRGEYMQYIFLAKEKKNQRSVPCSRSRA